MQSEIMVIRVELVVLTPNRFVVDEFYGKNEITVFNRPIRCIKRLHRQKNHLNLSIHLVYNLLKTKGKYTR